MLRIFFFKSNSYLFHILDNYRRSFPINYQKIIFLLVNCCYSSAADTGHISATADVLQPPCLHHRPLLCRPLPHSPHTPHTDGGFCGRISWYCLLIKVYPLPMPTPPPFSTPRWWVLGAYILVFGKL